MQREEVIKNLKQIQKLIKEDAPQIAIMRIEFLIEDMTTYRKKRTMNFNKIKEKIVLGLIYSVVAGLMGILATVAVLSIYYLIIGK